MDRKVLFNDNWRFTKRELGTDPGSMGEKDIPWTPVDIPHDFLIYNTNDLYEACEGWYKKEFEMDDPAGRIISICFEGVYMDSTVFVNGVTVGEWKYGYSSFEFNITNYLHPGSNEIMVRVIHQSPNSRWYSGAGIYRNVWLKTTAPVHLVTDGIYLSTRKEADGWYVELETEAVNEDSSAEPVEAVIRHVISDKKGNEVAISQSPVLINPSLTTDSQRVFVGQPELWDIESPCLYQLQTQIVIGGSVTDEVVQSFGFRTTRFDPEKGFFLNDRHVKLHGACMHHDLGALGSAMNKTALRRQLLILKQMGVNAIRTSHNMPAVELMELTDELGLLVDSESFDMWELKKTDYDYARFFPEWHEKDVASWVRRDRNHPSIIMWSIGNEIYDTSAGPRGLEITKMLRDLVLLHDPKKNGRVTIGSNYMSSENAQKCSDELKIAGYNYAEYLYQEHHKKYPDWCIYGSETASVIQSRGIYHFPLEKQIVTYEDEQCSSLDNCTVSWGGKSVQKVIIDDRDAKFCMGQFIWTGFDYIGEPTPYKTKNSYFGAIDTAGFPKDDFYLYQAEWTDYKTNPMIHVFPYWDFNEGQLIDVIVYSNAPKIELFLNDKSQGAVEIDHQNGKKLSGNWKLPYEPGTIRAVAYDENGMVIAEKSRSSFGDAARIVLKPDKTSLKADGLDMIFVEISMADKDGFPVENANNRVEVQVTGAGRLVGLDNGDSTDYDQYKGTSRRLFSGKLLAMIAAKQEQGDIHMKVTSIGLPDEELILKAIPCDKPAGVTATWENTKSEPSMEVPIRKIQLIVSGDRQLSKENPKVTVEAKLFPANTTYHDLVWKAVTMSGIETNIARIEAEGTKAIVTALGDGEFRLHCTASNGGKRPQIISELEFSVTGMGSATINPYQMVDAGLYNAGNYNYDTGLLGGITTEDGRENRIGFVGVDFGKFGSDEVTLPINYWGNDPIPLEIWEGIPGEEGAQLLLKTHYQANLVWETFQPNTFKLPRRLKGITSVCFVLYNRTNWKGFEFTRLNKAFEKLTLSDYDRIYGDSFAVREDSVENIGNNVSIEFEDMDFGEEGFSKLVICGRTVNDKNSINIRFSDEAGSVTRVVEFPHSEDYVEMEFDLEPVKGNKKVIFVFLPGSNFDFKWFRFAR